MYTVKVFCTQENCSHFDQVINEISGITDREDAKFLVNSFAEFVEETDICKFCQAPGSPGNIEEK